MINSIMLITAKGDLLISRCFRDDIRGAPDIFRTHVIAAKEVRSPVKQVGSATFFHILSGTIFVVAVTNQNANVSSIFEILHKLVEIFKAYFDNKFDEAAIRNNFVLIYELLDEIVDNGHPQITTIEALKLYITQGNKNVLEKASKEQLTQVTAMLTGVTGWRPPGIKYEQNELYIDVVEQVNLLVSATGTVLRGDVTGQILLNVKLSGMPECKLGLNDKLLMEREASALLRLRKGGPTATATGRRGIEIDDITFHQCVRLNKFDSDRTISFIPPDGKFELMKYRISDNINVPFRIFPIIKEIGRSRVEINVLIKTNFSARMIGSTVLVKIPCPKNTAICKFQTSTGSAKYQPDIDSIVWRIKRFPGETEAKLSANVELSPSVSNKGIWHRPPISMQFTVPMFTASGMHVRFLKVVEPRLAYQAVKWVRYMTKGGVYQHRI